MKKLLQNKPLVIALAAVLLLAVLAIASSGDRSVTAVESAVGSVARPVRTFAAKASSAIIKFFEELFNSTDLDEENRDLQTRIAQLELAMSDYENMEAELERLRKLLNYVEDNSDAIYVTAAVIGNDQGVWFDSFTINAGRNQGVEVDMPVVVADGLVGRVTSVGANWSKVTGIIDATSAVSIMVQRTRDNGMVRGTLDDIQDVESLELYYLPSDSDIVPGDVIVTSGLGGVFPKGLVVGTISEVYRQTDTSSQEASAIVLPAVDFRHLEEVMVIIGYDGGWAG